MDKLQAMALFVRVVETGGIARAAEGLRIPKATATTLLQKLEASLGVKLLNRTTRRVNVTPDGAAYYTRAAGILAEVREAEEALSPHSVPRGRVRVDAPTLIARSVIVPALPRFFADYPDIELALAGNERHFDLVAEGIDCALWIAEAADPSLVARRVGFLYLATCAAPSYIATHGSPAHPRDLVRHRCINHFSPATGETVEWAFSKDGERVQAVFPGNLALEDENSYVSAAEAGLGIAQLPAFVLKEGMERGTLDLVLADWLAEPSPLYVVYPQSRHLSRRVRVFVDWLSALIAEHDGIQLRSTLPKPARTGPTGQASESASSRA
ncbi:MAG TPA: LysR family transcriptional regulator [Steroidobacteraceae bacterium]|nr:LysR family transcriptional regulator [Steroidobacteraceae bacterium]